MTRSIRRRFAFSVGANLGRSALSFATALLLARLMGPAEYGKMAFLLGTFMGIRQLLDLGSSSALFTFLSQRPRPKRFYRLFFAWLLVQLVVPLAVIGLLFPASWVAMLWTGESRGLVVLAFIATFMQNSLWPVFQHVGEAERETVWVQGIGVAVVAVHLLAVVVLWRAHFLGLYAVFAAIAFEYACAGVMAGRRIRYARPDETDPGDNNARLVMAKFWRYCRPLVLYSVVGFIYEFADRWLLQRYGGAVEQAFYAVGAQFSAVALIATTAVLRIFWKEIAEANHRGDHARAGRLYRKTSRLLFLLGAIIAGFLVPWSEPLIRKLLGLAYVGGATTLALMFIYPVHQSMGQIAGTMLLATERVSIQVASGIAFMVVSIGVTYFVLAPGNAAIPGLGLASEGLALKMVVIQFLQVNILAFMIGRIWHWPFDWLYQPVSLLGALALGWGARQAAAWMSPASAALEVELIFAGVIYVILIAGFVYCLPALAGMTRAELGDDLRGILRTLRVSSPGAPGLR